MTVTMMGFANCLLPANLSAALHLMLKCFAHFQKTLTLLILHANLQSYLCGHKPQGIPTLISKQWPHMCIMRSGVRHRDSIQ